MKIAIIVADFNSELTSKMANYAKKQAKKLQIEIVKIIHVPGVFEIPYAINKIIKNKEINGIITLGVVKKGDTDHDVIVASTTSRKIMDLSLKHNKPIGLGIIGPNVTLDQAKKRLKGYSERAVIAAYKMFINKY